MGMMDKANRSLSAVVTCLVIQHTLDQPVAAQSLRELHVQYVQRQQKATRPHSSARLLIILCQVQQIHLEPKPARLALHRRQAAVVERKRVRQVVHVDQRLKLVV